MARLTVVAELQGCTVEAIDKSPAVRLTVEALVKETVATRGPSTTVPQRHAPAVGDGGGQEIHRGVRVHARDPEGRGWNDGRLAKPTEKKFERR
jgi:hypothetical protein